MSESTTALEILAETIKDQASAYKDQADVIGRILSSIGAVDTSNTEMKQLLGMLKDKSEVLHRAVDQLQRDHKEVTRVLNELNQLAGDAEDAGLTIDDLRNVLNSYTPANIPSPKDFREAVRDGFDTKTLRHEIKSAINDSIISILKHRYFWIFSILLLSGFLFLVGVKVLEIGNFLKITSNQQSVENK